VNSSQLDVLATASEETDLVLLSEPLLVEANDGHGGSISSFEHRIEVDPATELLPARIRSYVPGIELNLKIDTDRAGQYLPHEVAVYRRSSASDPWTMLPSAYDRDGTGLVTAYATSTGEFAVLAQADALQAEAPTGPTVVLDPDNDLARALWPSSATEVGELEKSFELANAVSARLSSECDANVILTRNSSLVDPVASDLRATVARNAQPDLTLTLAFNALNENPNDPFWGGSRADSGGTRVWTPEGSVRFGQRFLSEVEAYTTRPAPEGINQESTLLPYAPFVNSDIGSYVHLEALFLDNAFDQPVVESGFETIVDWVSATIINELAGQGMGCGEAPTTPPERKLAELRNLGYQNFLAYGADPVAFESGNFLHDENLFMLTGVGDQAIDMSLTFNNLDDRNTAFGEGWSFAYGSSIQLDGSGSALVRLGDGRSFYYPFDGEQWVVPDGANTTLTRNGPQLELKFNDSTRILFDEREFQTWVMAEMIDRQGNSMSFTWGRRVSDFVYELLEIVDEAGQKVVLTPNAAGRVSKVTHPDGREWGLSYEGQRLSSITDPRGVVRYSHRLRHQPVRRVRSCHCPNRRRGKHPNNLLWRRRRWREADYLHRRRWERDGLPVRWRWQADRDDRSAWWVGEESLRRPR
jgi:YD repeat-containing protein